MSSIFTIDDGLRVLVFVLPLCPCELGSQSDSEWDGVCVCLCVVGGEYKLSAFMLVANSPYS